MSEGAAGGPDPATVEVVRNYLTSAANEMQRTLVRTAPATIIYEILDFGISIFDADLNLIGESDKSLTVFLGANDFAIEQCLEYLGEDALVPGDVVLMNYPYMTATHNQDAVLVAPVFYDEEIVAYTTCRAHWVDLGAKDDGYVMDSTNVYQEGLLLPPVKVQKGGELDEELLEIVRYNSRMPETVIGELNAQIACLKTGQDRLTDLCEKYGPGTLENCIDLILDHGERTARSAVESLPNGTWSAVEYADGPRDDGEEVRIGVEVTIDGGDFHVDFSDSDDELHGMPLNVAAGMTETVAKFCLKALTTPTEDTNGGHFAPLSVSVPEGSIFNPQYPAPMFIYWIGMITIDVIFKALAKGMPDRIPASTGGDVYNVRLFGEHPETGQPFVEACNDGQGWGGSRHHDGENALNHYSGTLIRNNPVEVVENKAPVVLVDRLELRTDSGGAGTFRGGLGVRRDYRFVRRSNALAINQKTRTPGWGIEGGEPGAQGVVRLDFNEGSDWEQRVRVFVDNDDLYEPSETTKWTGMMRGTFEPGEVVSDRTGGGGGYGDPYDRDPKAVLEDVVDGYVSRESAASEYGVAISEQHEIDWEETASLRDDRSLIPSAEKDCGRGESQ